MSKTYALVLALLTSVACGVPPFQVAPRCGVQVWSGVVVVPLAAADAGGAR